MSREREIPVLFCFVFAIGAKRHPRENRKRTKVVLHGRHLETAELITTKSMWEKMICIVSDSALLMTPS